MRHSADASGHRSTTARSGLCLTVAQSRVAGYYCTVAREFRGRAICHTNVTNARAESQRLNPTPRNVFDNSDTFYGRLHPKQRPGHGWPVGTHSRGRVGVLALLRRHLKSHSVGTKLVSTHQSLEANDPSAPSDDESPDAPSDVHTPMTIDAAGYLYKTWTIHAKR
ncbi:hypothetical protein B0H10DRAFT_2196756 [Mycena sp. CBHHK59/15]|nr:hypothetical protein B0H10DRAFT_2196756 [Mycena sp. CBHHK59/15]